jgi:hypothetical protein
MHNQNRLPPKYIDIIRRNKEKKRKEREREETRRNQRKKKEIFTVEAK